MSKFAKFIQIVVGKPIIDDDSPFSMLYALDEDGLVWWYTHGNAAWFRYEGARDERTRD